MEYDRFFMPSSVSYYQRRRVLFLEALKMIFSNFRLQTTEEMLSVGLYLQDLNFYDGSSEILITGMQHARTLQAAIDKQHAWITKLQTSKLELQEWRRKGKRLLYSMMPRHIAQLLQEGVLANSICEVKIVCFSFAKT